MRCKKNKVVAGKEAVQEQVTRQESNTRLRVKAAHILVEAAQAGLEVHRWGDIDYNIADSEDS